ncbi:hypothetical protein Hanom_Chr13g01226341 [Helianthus anomalus]
MEGATTRSRSIGWAVGWKFSRGAPRQTLMHQAWARLRQHSLGCRSGADGPANITCGCAVYCCRKSPVGNISKSKRRVLKTIVK